MNRLIEEKREESERLRRRRKLLHFLQGNKAAWRDEDHPELDQGSAAWVRKIRHAQV
ncbi:MAG: hypothetical protein WB919_14230 [Candidatus Sulfotelmatobacter sp.]